MQTTSTLPAMVRARQTFSRPHVEDIGAAVRVELDRVFPSGSLKKGAEIGVTVGSRGITNIAEITRAVVDDLKRRDASPFIIPAMGSHGGGEGEAQRNLIAHYGVTEESMGAPIRHSMETRRLGTTDNGVETFIAEAAWNSDGILLLNRIKPHTDFKGRIESGLCKICAIGLGKYDGAQEYHTHIFSIGLGAAICAVAEKILETGKIVGGLGILENGYHETARLAGVTLDRFIEQEEKLLEESRGLMPSLPFKEIDLLICDRMGKNISGAGLDTNITGRSVNGYIQGIPWCEGMPGIYRIFVRDLSEESDGNAVGMGMVDFSTQRFADKINSRVTYINSVTACTPGNARMPLIFKTDSEAIEAALKSCPRRESGPIVVYVRDTLELEDMFLSEACVELLAEREGIEILGEPGALPIDPEGNIISSLGH